MAIQSPYQTFKRYRTLQTHRVSALPVVILMPHSACNCRCVMCDIWKANQHQKQLTEEDVSGLLHTLRHFNTQLVLMSGGEALLHSKFFRLCAMLKKEGIKIQLLSTGLLMARHAHSITEWVDEVIVSLDGDEAMHDNIRNIPGAFRKLSEGIAAIRSIDPGYRITCRTVIHRLNFRIWGDIINSAKSIGLNQVSFLPADISSTAFNRETPWTEERQHELLPDLSELEQMNYVVQQLYARHSEDFDKRFIAESRDKIMDIFRYYAAFYGFNDFPFKKCNAPWVSAVVEADGNVRPCFFHEVQGNIRKQPLDEIVNSPQAIEFRRTLDMDTNDTCRKCVCHLHLSPSTRL